MKDMDILCRSSAFVVPVLNREKFKKDFHVVTCSHVVAPWKWPKYYPAEWLQCVNETHTYYTVEIRQDDGTFYTQMDLLPRSYHHPTKDLAVMHLEHEKSSWEDLDKLGLDALTLDTATFDGREKLSFLGHEVVGPVLEDGTDLRKPVPNSTEGRFQFSTSLQNFTKTSRVLNDGMCGGPMCAERRSKSPSVGSGSRYPLPFSKVYSARGMVEGIVPESHSDPNLQGLASVISASDILSFLDAVEDGSIPCLEGGQSAEAVGRDQDPEKMDFENLAKADKLEDKVGSENSISTDADQRAMKERIKELLKQHGNSDETLVGINRQNRFDAKRSRGRNNGTDNERGQ